MTNLKIKKSTHYAMKVHFSILMFLWITSICFSQHKNGRFYATMNLRDAIELQKDFPADIDIIKSIGNEAAVLLTEEGSHLLHDKVLVHGPGYIFRASREEAVKNLTSIIEEKNSKVNFSITEDESVNAAINAINTQNIEDHIKELENYGTRFHNTASSTQSAQDLKVKWETIASNYSRSDVSVRLYNHTNTPMPSVIMTITGTELPDEFVVVGGHLDSIISGSDKSNAPGADDDASGIATITEAIRALFEINFRPKRTIEVMAYAAEEIGLVGSTEIAKDYKAKNINVIAVSQFDMTNYNGSGTDVYFIEDNTDATLNSFFKQLISHYNASGTHQITYGTALCGYACSDHASWHREGYDATFPFEASFASRNPNIHTPNDTFSISGTANHAAKFAKLCTEFLIEIAKSEGNLSVDDFENKGYTIYVDNENIVYTSASSNAPISKLIIYDITGKTVFTKSDLGNSGSIKISNINPGLYIVTAELTNKNKMVQKIILE